MKTISVVTPCFNEEANIRECYEAVREIFETKLAGYKREHVFCDNASSDRTVEILKEIAANDPDVRIIVNARNFGPMRSNYNGVMAATGDAVLLFLPADLQDPPNLLPEFTKLWESGYEIVYGIRATRQEGWAMRTVRKAYYNTITSLSDLAVPPGVGDFQLVDRKVIEAMRTIKDVYPFMRMMTFECGFRAVGVPYTWLARKRGFSKNRLTNLFDQGMNGIVTFTKIPLRIALLAGVVLSIISILFALFNVAHGLLADTPLASKGILTIIVGLFFFGGLQIFFLGMMGEYILQIYAQLRNSPLVVERERVNFVEKTKEIERV